MRLKYLWVPTAAAGLCAATAGAATFSFASDDNHDGPTWLFDADQLWTYGDVGVDLLVDVDEDGPGEAVVFEDAVFEADITLDYQSTADLGGGLYLHIFTASGTASWNDLAGGALLDLEFFSGVMTAVSDSADAISSTATLAGEDFDMGAAVYTPGQPLIDLGLTQLVDPQDFAFTLTDINDGAGAPLDNGLLGPGDAEGSYSGSANIPAPGSLALLGLSALTFTRRRS
jgi:hypothetical protein